MAQYTNDFRNAQTLDDLKIMLNKYFEWFFSSLDHLNVYQLFTEYCNIRSKDGETALHGPLLEMYDKQATPQLRLKQGYDIVTSDFVFELYNKAGVKTVGVDSNGNGTLSKVTLRNDLTGSAYIQIDNTGFRANDGLKNTVEIDTLGKAYFRGDITSEATITGATIRSGAVGTNRIELSGGKFRGINSNEQLTGLYFEVLSSGIADISFYHAGSKKLEIYDEITNSWIRPGDGASFMRIGKAGYSTSFNGIVDFTSATVNGLSSDYTGTHNHGIPDGTYIGITDASGNLIGGLPWVASGGHLHSIS